MRADDRVRVLHMIDAADLALQFMSGRKREDLDDDRLLLFAVVRALEVLGEAAAKVSESTRAAAPDLPWAAIIGMRNRLIHGYFDIDTEIVWKTVTEELPTQLPRLQVLVKDG